MERCDEEVQVKERNPEERKGVLVGRKTSLIVQNTALGRSEKEAERWGRGTAEKGAYESNLERGVQVRVGHIPGVKDECMEQGQGSKRREVGTDKTKI